MADDTPTTSTKPTHRLVHMSEREVTKDRTTTVKTTYTEICGLWATKGEDGSISGTIPAGISLSGRILIQPADRPTKTELSDQ